MFLVLAVSATQIQDYLSFLELLHHVFLDLLDDFVVEVIAKAVVGLLNVFLLDLERLHLFELTRMKLAHVFRQQRIALLHGFLIVTLGIAVEVIRAFTGRKFDLSKGQRDPS